MSAEKKKESEALRAENLRAREHYDPDGMRALMSMMCLGAINDWVRAESVICQIDKTREIRRYPNFRENERRMAAARKKECEGFFDSDIFLGMTGMDSVKDVVEKLKKSPPHQVAEIGKRMMKHG